MSEETEGIEKALSVIRRCGGNDGAHHKDWVLDQVVRALTRDGYGKWVAKAKSGEDGPDTYSYSVGIAP